VSVLLQLDNQTAVAYINNLGEGGEVSPLLTQLVKELWMWTLSKNIILAAEHILGTTNCEADAESRTQTDQMDWSLHQVIQENQSSVGPIGGGPICISPVKSAAMVLQLETGSISRGHRRLEPIVGSTERICESSMVSGWQSSFTSEEPECSGNLVWKGQLWYWGCYSTTQDNFRATGTRFRFHPTIFRWNSCHN